MGVNYPGHVASITVLIGEWLASINTVSQIISVGNKIRLITPIVEFLIGISGIVELSLEITGTVELYYAGNSQTVFPIRQ